MYNEAKCLNELGLSEQEISIYIALLRLGESPASTIAKEIGIKRTTVYPLLKSLTAKGCLLLYFKKNVRFYRPQKPKKLLKSFEKKIENFNSIIPFLESLEKKQISIPGLRFIETNKELEKFYYDILAEYKNKSYYIIGDIEAWENNNKSAFLKQYRKDRAKAGIKTKILLSYNSKIFNPETESLLREYKYLPEKYSFKSTMDIFKDKILIVSHSFNSIAVVIEIPEMVSIFKSMFEIIWNRMAI
jgi:sugar-specific transcriptional regulator TrmB